MTESGEKNKPTAQRAKVHRDDPSSRDWCEGEELLICALMRLTAEAEQVWMGMEADSNEWGLFFVTMKERSEARDELTHKPSQPHQSDGRRHFTAY